jgi:hypothetical protein
MSDRIPFIVIGENVHATLSPWNTCPHIVRGS